MIPPLCRHFLKPFRPPAVRFSPVLCVSQYIKIIQKKQKGCGVETEQSSPRPAPLSPEQLDKIARNKKAALERLSSVQTPPGFGESWRKALSAEFGKPYFKQVRRGGDGILHSVSVVLNSYSDFTSLPQLTSFVCEERKRHTVYPPAEHVFTWTQMCDIRDVSV